MSKIKKASKLILDELIYGGGHLQSLGAASVVLNLIDGEIQLGRWQSIMFIEMDRPRDRKIQVQIMGE